MTSPKEPNGWETVHPNFPQVYRNPEGTYMVLTETHKPFVAY